jgi:hypothetical protein
MIDIIKIPFWAFSIYAIIFKEKIDKKIIDVLDMTLIPRRNIIKGAEYGWR